MLSRLGLATSALLISLATLIAPVNAAEKSVAITQIVEHPALDAIRKGVKDELKQRGFEAGKNLKWTYESAQGAPATAAQIAKKFAGERPDVIVAIATPSAQAAVASARGIKVVFSAVTDPVGAKLVKSWDKPTQFVTGVSDLTPIDQHLALVKKVVPDAKSVGVIYNPGEANSVSLVKLVKKYAPANGMKVVEAVSPKSADVQTATRSLIGKVDAIYIPTDNTVISALEGVIKIAEQAKIPLIAGDTDSVNRGAVAALGFNYYTVGRQTGVMVARILNGESPASIPVEGVKKSELFVNPEAARRMGIELSQDIIKSAKKVVK